MKKFCIKVTLIFAPLIFMCLVLIVYDANNYLGLQNFKDYKGLPMYRLRDFKRNLNNEQKNVFIIGDSRFAHFDDNGVKILKKDNNIQHLAFGGAALNESIDMFWWTVLQKKPETVIFGTSFYNMNSNYVYNRMLKAFEIAEDPFLYFTDFSYVKESLMKIINKIFPSKPQKIDKTDYAKTIYKICDNYELNYDQIERLKEVADYCDKNDIEFVVVFAPAGQNIWQQVIKPLNLYDEMEEYKALISKFAQVADFENENDFLTKNYDQDFSDGFHFDTKSDGFLEYKKQIYNLA